MNAPTVEDRIRRKDLDYWLQAEHEIKAEMDPA
jgi:hypothetical protein